MNKLFMSLLLVVLTSLTAVAQNTVVNNPDNRAYFGIRVGGDLVCPGSLSVSNVDVSVFNVGGGVEFGGIYNIPVVANFYVEPGLKLFYDTYSIKKEILEVMTDENCSASFRKFGMRIPVMAGYHFDFNDNTKLSVFTGPELEIGFSAKEHDKVGNVSATENLYGNTGSLNRCNLIWGVGAGISVQHVYFGINGGIGMLNMSSETGTTFHENRVTFSLGYNF